MFNDKLLSFVFSLPFILLIQCSLNAQCSQNLITGVDSTATDMIQINADSCSLELSIFVTNQGVCDMDSVAIDILVSSETADIDFTTDTLGAIATGDTLFYTVMFGSDLFLDPDTGECIDTAGIDYKVDLSSTPQPQPITTFIDCPIGTGMLEVCANNTSIPCGSGADIGCIAPIDLQSFDGKMFATQALLRWTTSIEINNDYFVIEHSLDGKYFESIGRIDGTGNSYENVDYSFTHENPNFGDNYYRLMQIDFDGQYSYSSIIVLNKERNEKFSMNPNPATNEMFVHASFESTSPYWINICGVDGRILESHLVDQNQQQTQISLSSYQAGSYLVQIIGNGFNEFKRLIII